MKYQLTNDVIKLFFLHLQIIKTYPQELRDVVCVNWIETIPNLVLIS